MTSIKILSMLRKMEKPASKACRLFNPLPQVLTNISCLEKNVLSNSEVCSVISECEQELAGVGRLLVRYSGTEAAVRVMVEAEDAGSVDSISRRIAAAVERYAK